MHFRRFVHHFRSLSELLCDQQSSTMTLLPTSCKSQVELWHSHIINTYQPLEISIDVVPSSGIGMDNYNYNMHLKPSCIEKVSQILCQENKPCFIALYSTYGILRLFNQSTPVLELFLSLRTVLEFSIFFQSL